MCDEGPDGQRRSWGKGVLGEGGRITEGDLDTTPEEIPRSHCSFGQMAVARGVSRPFWNVVEHGLWNGTRSHYRVRCQGSDVD